MARGELALPQTDPVFFILKEIHRLSGAMRLKDTCRHLRSTTQLPGFSDWNRRPMGACAFDRGTRISPTAGHNNTVPGRSNAVAGAWQLRLEESGALDLSESQRSRVSSRAVSRMFSSSASCLRRISVMRSFSSQPRSFRTCLAIRRLTSACSPLRTAAPWPPRLRIKVSVSSDR